MNKALEAQLIAQKAKEHMLAKRYELALDCMEQALSIHRELGDKHNEAANLHNIGMLYTLMGDLRSAVNSYKEALTLAEELQFDALVKEIDQNLTTILRSLGVPPKK